jgi:hypothetical protein
LRNVGADVVCSLGLVTWPWVTPCCAPCKWGKLGGFGKQFVEVYRAVFVTSVA